MSSEKLRILLDLKKKVKGYPLNGVIKGAILEEELDMWIFNEINSININEKMLAEYDGQIKFKLSNIPIKDSIIAHFSPSRLLSIDLFKVEGNVVYLHKNYADLIKKNDEIEFIYKYKKNE